MSARGQGAPPHANGAYYTDPRLARACVERCLSAGLIRSGGVVLEPSVGGGVWVDALRDVSGLGADALRILAIDNDPAAGGLVGPDAACADFLTTWPVGWPVPDLALGNPPYSVVHAGRVEEVASSHVTRCFAIGILNVVFVMRAGFLGGSTRRRAFWRSHPPRELWSLHPRPSFTGKGSDATEYMVMWWDQPWRGHTTHEFLEWR